jgi:CheY-like chemotaxis protein
MALRPDAAASLLEVELLKLSESSVRVPASLPAVLDAVLGTISALAATRGVSVRTSVPADLPPVAINADALRHALLELMSYLLQSCAGPGEGARIDLTATHDQETVRLSLTTTGAGGMRTPDAGGPAPEDADRRLVVSRRLLEIHGGALEPDGSPRGGEVWVSLPVAPRQRVLIVDDSPDFILLLERYLRGHPYQVLAARDAEQALGLARDGEPDVVVLDVLIPSRDGWDILQQLRSLEQLRDLPIVICSVLGDATLARSLGADYCLTKPVTQRALLSALAECRAARAPNRGRS